MKINRHQLVSRHNPILTNLNPLSPLSVGNGEFAFTADVTGMQTFSELYSEQAPLCTQSQWGWHTAPAISGNYYSPRDLALKYFEAPGVKAGYAVFRDGQEEIFDWLRQNPHRLHLGRIGLELYLPDGARATPEDIQNIHQTLDLWRGILESRFMVSGVPTKVTTCCHPCRDILAFSIESELIGQNRLRVRFAFPYGSPDKTAADWFADQKQSTVVVRSDDRGVSLMRILDNNRYFVDIRHSNPGRLFRDGQNAFTLAPASNGQRFEFTVSFTQNPSREEAPSFTETMAACKTYWESFWLEGGAIELAVVVTRGL